ncbi:hypothetical protein HPB49_005266 [Dermacentor silvarum]|uniref:Uncharacterized protein n=1 Tax=Dermacentor silvarum TaxID=543639 RepID=A0ACB8DV91_DERSI|nr:hypothetical protein HPB49_005266 [Dermacentor silvarum]
MADRDGEVKHSTLNNEYGSVEPRGDEQRSRFSPETPTTARSVNANGTTYGAHDARDDDANDGATANENAAIQITTMPDLTATLPTFSGTDNESVGEWITSVESMPALRKEFDKQPLFCEWVENVNARRQKEDETITDYMYCRLQRIKRGKYALSDDDIVDWLIQGVRLESARPVLAAFHDLRKGSVSEFINYVRQFDRRMASTRSDGTHAKTSPRNEPQKKDTRDDHQQGKPTRLPADICARCLQRGHRAKDCPRPDTRTEEEKVAAARRKEERAAREQRTNRIVTARSEDNIEDPAVLTEGLAAPIGKREKYLVRLPSEAGRERSRDDERSSKGGIRSRRKDAAAEMRIM